MKFTPPTKPVFYISIFFVVLGIVAFFVPVFSGIAIWFVLTGYVFLFYGVIMKGF